MAKFLSITEIEEIIKNYIDDDRRHQAILLDGAWGNGKTYFVKNQLFKELKETYTESDIIMISLYGVDSVNGIQRLLFDSYLVEHLGKNNKFGKVLIGSTKLLKAFGQPALDFFEDKIGTKGIIKNELSNAKKFAEENALKKASSPILIIDDVERCNVDIRELLGFFNRLTESIGCNVLLICNEKEIQEKDKYKKAKEKVVGLTIPFCISMESVFDDIIKNYVHSDFSRQLLKSSEQDILSIFDARGHANLRTLISVCIAADVILGHLDDEEFTSRQGYDKEIANIIKYATAASITIALGEKNKSLPQGVRYGNISKKVVDYGTNITQYAFVDEYLEYQKLDEGVARSDIDERLKEAEKEAAEDKKYQRHKNLSLSKLLYWYELTDDEVKKLTSDMLTELENKEYLPQDFKDIIITLMKINNNSFGFRTEDDQDTSDILFDSTDDRMFDGYIPSAVKTFKSDDFEEWEPVSIEKYVKKMMPYFDDPSYEITKDMLMGIFDDKDFAYQYREYVKPLYDEIDRQNEEKLKEVDSKSMESGLTFDDDFIANCYQKKQDYFKEGKFLRIFGADALFDSIMKSGPEQIHNFCEGLLSVYNVVNIGDFLEQDLPTVTELLKRINENRSVLNKEKSRTKAIALHRLEKDLKDYEGRLNKNYVIG